MEWYVPLDARSSVPVPHMWKPTPPCTLPAKQCFCSSAVDIGFLPKTSSIAGYAPCSTLFAANATLAHLCVVPSIKSTVYVPPESAESALSDPPL